MQKKLMAVSLFTAATLLSATVLADNHVTNVQTGFNANQGVVGGAGEGCVVSGEVLQGQARLENCGEAPMMEAKPTPKPADKPKPTPPATRVTLKTDVLFDTNKSVIKNDQMARMAELARELSTLKSFDGIMITGNADYRGGTQFNQRLSERRALAVVNALTRYGVPQNSIRAQGRGESAPIIGQAACRGKSGSSLSRCLAPDRRVDVDVINAIK